MVENYNLVPSLSEMMNEYTQEKEEVHQEPQIKSILTEEPEAQPETEQPVEEGRRPKRLISVCHNEDAESEEERAFFSAKVRSVWEKQLADKGFINERGFGKFISPFSEIIEKKGWNFFL